MHERLGSVSEREKETLRLLLQGHEAKSIASALGLSVHTVNERLREARRKLGVGSSREAARLLAQAEGQSPNFLGDKQIGVAPTRMPDDEHGLSEKRWGRSHTVAWLIGGMAIMLAILAAVVIATVSHNDGKASTSGPSVVTSAVSTASDKAGANAAEQWARLLDGQDWGESWKASGSAFRSQLTEVRWVATIQPLRQQLGPVASRSLKSVSSATSLPGAPDGEYKIVQFATAFANKPDAIETVVLAYEGTAWKVNGYFIR